MKPRNPTSKITTNGLRINTQTHSPGKSPSSSSWPDLFSSWKTLYFLRCLSLLSVATKGRLSVFTKHDKHETARVRRLFPRRSSVHTHHHVVSDQSPTLSSGMRLHWGGPPTSAAVSVKTYSRLAWQKRDKHHIHCMYIYIWTPAPVSQQLLVRDFWGGVC